MQTYCINSFCNKLRKNITSVYFVNTEAIHDQLLYNSLGQAESMLSQCQVYCVFYVHIESHGSPSLFNPTRPFNATVRVAVGAELVNPSYTSADAGGMDIGRPE